MSLRAIPNEGEGFHIITRTTPEVPSVINHHLGDSSLSSE